MGDTEWATEPKRGATEWATEGCTTTSATHLLLNGLLNRATEYVFCLQDFAFMSSPTRTILLYKLEYNCIIVKSYLSMVRRLYNCIIV